MFGLTFEKLLLIGVIAVFIIGPDRLPLYTQKMGQFVRQARDFITGAKGRMKDELGDDFNEIEWKKLDPRQYDPRRIIREALLDDAVPGVNDQPSRTAMAVSAPAVEDSAYVKAKARREARRDPNAATPFDNEAT